jgi:hypothetical protein
VKGRLRQLHHVLIVHFGTASNDTANARNQHSARDVHRVVKPEITHEINAIDVRQTGYVIRCVCGWLTESEERESISAAWLTHVSPATV